MGGQHRGDSTRSTREYAKLRGYLNRKTRDDAERVRLDQAEQVASHEFPGQDRRSEMWCWRVLDLFGRGK
jgi:hypothetical protein